MDGGPANLPPYFIIQRSSKLLLSFVFFLLIPSVISLSPVPIRDDLSFLQIRNPGHIDSNHLNPSSSEVPSSSPDNAAVTESTIPSVQPPTDDDDDDLYINDDDTDKQYASGEHFEREQRIKRQRMKERKWLAEGLANRWGDNATSVEDMHNQNIHPIKGSRHALLWRYQFGTIIFVLIAVYIVQLLVDFKGRKTFSLYSRPSTCLMLGANFRGLGETKLVSFARFFTCAFLHAHIFHLISNVLSIYASWMYFSIGPGMKDKNIWVFHWTFPIFMLTAFFGSVYSYQTTLKHCGFSIGASGGCLGLSSSFLLLAVRFEGVPQHRKFQLIMTVVSIVASCVPWDTIFSGQGGSTDLGAHAAGALGGAIIALALSDLPAKMNESKLIDSADIFSCVLLVLLLLAYAEIAREYIIDGRELLVRAYVKWLGMETKEPDDGRRYTSPGRLQCELLTEEYLYLLDSEKVEDDPEVILKRLEEENKNRRKTSPDFGGFVY